MHWLRSCRVPPLPCSWTTKGITVAQDTELRNKFREAGVEYTVVKNTLTRFAANKVGYNHFDEMLNGTTSSPPPRVTPLPRLVSSASLPRRTRTF